MKDPEKRRSPKSSSASSRQNGTNSRAASTGAQQRRKRTTEDSRTDLADEESSEKLDFDPESDKGGKAQAEESVESEESRICAQCELIKKRAPKPKSAISQAFGNLAKKAASASGQPVTFMLALGVILIWAITGPVFQYNDTWQLVINTGTTIITFLMVFLIQNTQNRDTTALQVKLDEVIRALTEAENDVIDLEDKSEEEIEAMKDRYTEFADRLSKKAEQLEKTGSSK